MIIIKRKHFPRRFSKKRAGVTMEKYPKINSIQNLTIYIYNKNLCYMLMQLLYALLEWESYYSEYRKLSEEGRVLTTCLFVCLFVWLLFHWQLSSVLYCTHNCRLVVSGFIASPPCTESLVPDPVFQSM